MCSFLTNNSVSEAPTLAGTTTKTSRATAFAFRHRHGKSVLLLVVPVLLVAQSPGLDKALAMPTMSAPPVIVLVPSGGKISVTLLATKDLPSGTNVLPVVTIDKKRRILPSITISSPGAYPLAIARIGSDVIAYITPPTGAMYKLRSVQILSGYQYDGDTLTIYGTFTGGQTLAYVGPSLTPAKPTLKQGHLELRLKPTEEVTTVTVYQAGGFCDSVVVRLSQVELVR